MGSAKQQPDVCIKIETNGNVSIGIEFDKPVTVTATTFELEDDQSGFSIRLHLEGGGSAKFQFPTSVGIPTIDSMFTLFEQMDPNFRKHIARRLQRPIRASRGSSGSSALSALLSGLALATGIYCMVAPHLITRL